MNIPKFLVISVFLLIISSLLVIAECPPDCPQDSSSGSFDASNPESFDYTRGDYSTISDWTKVDWNKIPPNRIPEIPADSLQYSSLNSQQRSEMTVLQIIPNLENIENLAQDVNWERAQQAILQTKEVTVQGSPLNRLKIENGVLITKEGKFDFGGKQGWEIAIDYKDRDKIIVLRPSDITLVTISTQDSFTIPDASLYTSDGSSHKIYFLSFKDGRAYISPEDLGRIDTYNFERSTKPILVYFDPGLTPAGNGVAITKEGLKISSAEDSKIKINVLSGNQLFNLVKRDYSTTPPTLVASEDDTLSISISNGDSLDVVSRASEGKTPLIYHHDGAGETKIETGRLEIQFYKGQLNIIPPSAFKDGEPIDYHNSAAFELISDSPKMEQTIRTSSSNRFILLQDGKQIAGNNMGLRVSDNIEPNMIKTEEDLKAKYLIHFKSFKTITANLAQLTDEWLEDKPGIKKYIFSINFDDLSNNAGVGVSTMVIGEKIVDPATFAESSIRGLVSPLELLDHEFVHILDNYVRLSRDEPREIQNKFAEYKKTKEYQDAVDQRVALLDDKGESPSDISSRVKLQLMDEFIMAHQSEILRNKYDEIALLLSKSILEDDKYLQLVQDAKHLRLKAPEAPSEWQTSPPFISPEPTREEKAKRISISQISVLNKALKSLGSDPKSSTQAQQLGARLNTIVAQDTGLYPYAFSSNWHFFELSSVYSELPPSEARRYPELAQLELDRAHSLDIKPGDPDEWILKKAEDRYYTILGGKDGSYCTQNPCGPCLKYTLTCQK